MITAVDSSVILDILVDDPDWRGPSLAALKRARAEGRLIVSEVAVAEIAPAVKAGAIDDLLESWDLVFVPCGLEAARHAGECFARYLARGGKRGRIVADFLIGAHAQHHADRLLARDDGFTRDYFGELRLMGV